MSVFPTRGLKPFYDELKTWLFTSHNADGTLRGDVLADMPISTATSLALADKADQVDLDATNTTVATKANQSSLDTTNTTVATKANQSSLDTTNTNVAANTTAIAYTNPGSALGDGQIVVGTATTPTKLAKPSGNDWILKYANGILGWTRSRAITVEDYKTGGVVDVAAALAAVPATGGDVVFRGDEGTNYLIPNAGLTTVNKTRITTQGSHPAILKAPATATGTGFLNVGTSITIENIEIDLQSNATMTRGIYLNANLATYRDIAVRDVIVRNAADAAFYFWRAQGVELESVQALDCVTGIHMVQVGGQVVIDKPKIVNTVSGRMTYGIRTSSGSSYEGIGIEIMNPYVSGASYATASGSEAHGILIYRTRGAKIIGGTITACGNPANKQGGGVVFSADSHMGQIDGTHIHDCVAAGMWTEILPATDTTLGSNTIKRGVSARGVRSERNRVGFIASYGAGTHFVDCWAMESAFEGFYTDSENVLFEACKSINAWTEPTAGAPAQNGGAKAAFRAYGSGSHRNAYSGAFIGCDALDNRTTKMQQYGFAAEDRGYRFVGNLGEGLTGAYSGGTTNNKFAGNSW